MRSSAARRPLLRRPRVRLSRRVAASSGSSSGAASRDRQRVARGGGAARATGMARRRENPANSPAAARPAHPAAPATGARPAASRWCGATCASTSRTCAERRAARADDDAADAPRPRTAQRHCGARRGTRRGTRPTPIGDRGALPGPTAGLRQGRWRPRRRARAPSTFLLEDAQRRRSCTRRRLPATSSAARARGAAATTAAVRLLRHRERARGRRGARGRAPLADCRRPLRGAAGERRGCGRRCEREGGGGGDRRRGLATLEAAGGTEAALEAGARRQ